MLAGIDLPRESQDERHHNKKVGKEGGQHDNDILREEEDDGQTRLSRRLGDQAEDTEGGECHDPARHEEGKVIEPIEKGDDGIPPGTLQHDE